MSKRTELHSGRDEEMWGTSGRQRTSRVFADEGIAAKATGFVENIKLLREKAKREKAKRE
jgi:hypothetical protein